MSTSKRTQPPVSEPKPQPASSGLPAATVERKDTVARHFEALQGVLGLLNNLDNYDLRQLEMFRLILSRDRGFLTPVEAFLCELVRLYGANDDAGDGLPLEDIEEAVNDLRESLPGAIEQARFLADRYPKR